MVKLTTFLARTATPAQEIKHKQLNIINIFYGIIIASVSGNLAFFHISGILR